jgi:hypothetical protein
MVRSYLTVIYSTCSVLLKNFKFLIQFTGQHVKNPKASVPWAKIAADPEQWVVGWDSRVPIKDPSKLRQSEVTTLYQGWLEKQEKGEELLKFINPMDRGKESSKNVSELPALNDRPDEVSLLVNESGSGTGKKRKRMDGDHEGGDDAVAKEKETEKKKTRRMLDVCIPKISHPGPRKSKQ